MTGTVAVDNLSIFINNLNSRQNKGKEIVYSVGYRSDIVCLWSLMTSTASDGITRLLLVNCVYIYTEDFSHTVTGCSHCTSFKVVQQFRGI